MKSLFFAILLSGLSAFAGGPKFEIISGDVKPDHGGPYNTGSISIDYTAKTVSLYIDRNKCPAGLYCTKEVRFPLMVTLPITSIEEGICNHKTVTASVDERPVDGSLEKLTVLDFSQNTCPTFAEIIGDAEYLTSHYNRFEGQLIEAASTFKTKLVRSENSTAVLLEKSMHVGFAPPEYTGRFSLQILIDGTIQRVDNKNQIQELGVLSVKELAKAKKLVAGLKNVKLTRPNHPECMDAPSYSIVAHQGKKDIELWNQFGCIESKTNNKDAKALIQLINKIQAQYPEQE